MDLGIAQRRVRPPERETRVWDDAERLRHQMEFPETVKLEPEILPPTALLPSDALIQAPVTSITVIQASSAAMVPAERVTIDDAVKAYLADAVSRELAEDTLSKLERIFRKQFLTWCQIAGLEYLDQEPRCPNQLPQHMEGRPAGQAEEAEPLHRLLLGVCSPRLHHQEPGACTQPD
jgi:hypothetical protein